MITGREIRVHALIDSLTWGGAEALLFDFATVAPSEGIRLSVGFLKDARGSPAALRLRKIGIDPVLAPIPQRLSPSALQGVRSHLRQMRPDLVHTHLGSADILGGIAARSLGIPVVSTIHAAEWGQDPRERLRARLTALVRRRCDSRVIAVSDSARMKYLERAWDTPERVIRVYNGIVGKSEPGAGPRVRAEFGLEPDHFVVAMTSRLTEGKGHDLAIEAVAALRDRFPQLRLLILGEGKMRSEVERIAAANLPDAAIFGGYRQDVMAVLDATDVLLHPSRSDAFPTSLLEAMAASVPVVATAVDGVLEIVEPQKTGLLLEPEPPSASIARALETLLSQPDLRRGFGERGRERFERDFTAERWIQRIRGVYESVVA